MPHITLEEAEETLNRLLDDREANGLMTSKEAADYLLSTENSLRAMRSKGYGPPFHKVGWTVFYKREELDAYQATVGSSSRRSRFRAAEMSRGAPGSTRMRP